jgi:hypothetical protein
MSYAGTYGPDETCEHDQYRRNCWHCNGAVERFRREYSLRQAHPSDAKNIRPETRVITVYDAKCPNQLCSWSRHGVESKTMIEADLSSHVAECEHVATEWASASDIKLEAFGRRYR